MRTSTETGDAGATPNSEACSETITDDGIESATKGRESIPISYLDWCYHLSIGWTLWSVIGDISKEETPKNEHSSTVLPRIDSGIELHLLRGDKECSIRPVSSIPPSPINLTFMFGEAITTKLLDYRIYSQWTNFNTLLDELARDGIIVCELWDVKEGMEIQSGDWDARVRPGWVVEVWCFTDVGRFGLEEESSESESEEEMESSSEIDGVYEAEFARSEHPWWFARWRERVERGNVKREGVIEGPSWFMMMIWCTSIIAVIVVFSLIY